MIFNDKHIEAPVPKQCDVHFRFNTGAVVPMNMAIAERYSRKGKGQIIFAKPPKKSEEVAK
jgi:hypothetical protein